MNADALALARSADRRAEQALRKASEAERKADTANEGCRSVYLSIGEFARELGALSKKFYELQEEFRRLVLTDEIRARVPSVVDVAEAAAKKAVEETGRHAAVSSDRVREIVSAEQNKRTLSVVLKVLLAVAGAVVSALIGHAWK